MDILVTRNILSVPFSLRTKVKVKVVALRSIQQPGSY